MAFDEVSLPPPIDPPPLDGSFQLPHGDIDVLAYSHDASAVHTQASSHILMEDEHSYHYVMSTNDNLITRFVKPM